MRGCFRRMDWSDIGNALAGFKAERPPDDDYDAYYNQNDTD